MKTVAINDAKANLPCYLKEVSRGETVVIARGGRPLAKLVPFQEGLANRPKVGQVMDHPLHIADETFHPVGELEAWGL